MRGSPPLRFLAIVLGGWVALRTVLIAPPRSAPPADAAAAAAQGRVRIAPSRKREIGRALAEPLAARARGGFAAAIGSPGRAPPRRPLPSLAAFRLVPRPVIRALRETVATAAIRPSVPTHFAVPPIPDAGSASPGRWSLSAWSFVRRGDSAPLATGGQLGGSQAGARLTYRLNRDSERSLALSARVSAPLRRPAGAEAALGLDWQPIGQLPIHLLAERRRALGREGRSAFDLTAYGGVSDAALGPFRIDAYAQAGMVGARSRDLFGDGSIRLSLPLARNLRLGAGAWAAAQPGLNRLDVGPQAALRLPVAGRSVTIAADWRLRVAGKADPGSGPTLTLSTDF